MRTCDFSKKTNNSNVSSCYGYLKVTSVSQLVFEIRWSSPKASQTTRFVSACSARACVVVGCMSPGGARIECKPCPMISRRIRCRCLIWCQNSGCGPISSFYGTKQRRGGCLQTKGSICLHVNANRLQVKGGRVVICHEFVAFL